jgi:hypothetical protein
MSGGTADVRMRIFSNGNVLIGTTTDAGYKLDVNGTTRSQGALTVNNNAIFGGSEGAQKRLVSIGLNGADYQHRYILLAKVPTFGNATVNAGFRGSITMERVNGIGIDVHDDFDFTVSYGNAIAFRQTSYQSNQTSLVQVNYGGTQYLALYAYSAPGWAIAYMDVVQTNYGGWLDSNTFVAIETTTPIHSSVSYSSNTTMFKQSVSAPNFTGTLYGTASQSNVTFSNSGSTFYNFYDGQPDLTDKNYLIYNTTDAPRGTLGLYTVSMNKWSGDYGSMFAIDCEPGQGIGYIKSKYGGTWGSWKMLIDGSSNQTIGGTKTFTSNVTAPGFFNSSDNRLKDLIDYDYSVLDIKPITYLWKDSRDNKKHIGYSAQEVQKVMPDAVNEGEDGMLSVNYIEVLVAKIAELENRIKQLEK